MPPVGPPNRRVGGTVSPAWKMRNGAENRFFSRRWGPASPAGAQRKETGFAVPLSHWFRADLKDFLRDHLLAPSFLQRGFVRPEFLTYLIDEHLLVAGITISGCGGFWFWNSGSAGSGMENEAPHMIRAAAFPPVRCSDPFRICNPAWVEHRRKLPETTTTRPCRIRPLGSFPVMREIQVPPCRSAA